MTKIKNLDTIRMIALLLIIIYHFFPKFLAAGFLGVDMLLVLSGFLITRSIFTEIQKTGTFHYKSYFRKRFNRIFPTLLLCLTITLLITLFSNPDFLVDIDKQVAAALGFVTNWYEILSGGSYESQFIEHLFLHTWYLGIEIFFYLIWAFILIALVKLNQKKVKKDVPRRNIKIFIHTRNQILVISFCLAVVGMVLMLIGIIKKQNTAYLYFSNLTRSYPLYIGSLAACLFHGNKKFKRMASTFNPQQLKKLLWRNTLIACAVILLLAFVLAYDNPLTYYFGIFAVSLATCVLIYVSLYQQAAESIQLFTAFTPNFSTFFSKISYPLYLFHWPLFVLAKQHFTPAISVLIALGGALLLALFAYYIWEPAWQGILDLPWLKVLNQKKYLLSGSIGIFLLIFIISLSKAPWLTSMQESLLRNALMQSKDAANQIIVKAEQQELDNQEKTFLESIKGVTILGDSVTVGPRDYLQEHIPDSYVDALEYRQLSAAEDLIKEMQSSKDLKEYVVIALGTNSSYEDPDIVEKIIADFPAKYRLIFITPYDGRGDASWSSWQYRDYLLTLEDKYDFVTVGDWFAVAQKNPKFFEGTDFVHFYGNIDAYEAYTKLIQDTLNRAKERSAKP